jgi:hypothetical protein
MRIYLHPKLKTSLSGHRFSKNLVGVLTKCLWFDEENLRTYTRPLACGTFTKLASGGNRIRSWVIVSWD